LDQRLYASNNPNGCDALRNKVGEDGTG